MAFSALLVFVASMTRKLPLVMSIPDAVYAFFSPSGLGVSPGLAKFLESIESFYHCATRPNVERETKRQLCVGQSPGPARFYGLGLAYYM